MRFIGLLCTYYEITVTDRQNRGKGIDVFADSLSQLIAAIYNFINVC